MKLFFLSAMFLFLNSALAQSSLPNSVTEKNDKVNDTTFVNLKSYSNAFVFDMKYATDDNFLKAKVYDCAECFLRLKTVKALVKANTKLAQKGYKIKIYDCYRPLDIQKKMWEIVPNPKYVANPKTGSIHNRGGAVDISLVTLQGEAVDMGTDFDFFGEKASHLYQDLPKNVLQNRKLLKSVMISAGFNSFDSEWWHYNLKAGLKNPVSNVKWECE
ncbi:D-alanyl-D-alanine dipeptidase [Flavobacterium sp. CECT 9288]|uniref:D-alanyl-D-alanine dipeptidase n=1 Tax=Flavobacterium sp. CECT 9288 TaxID=2845819 RepID=UPI001E629D09|nr:D-alanyl-D-alanine dipeptidase [Flavobacterium sp. CECT 9288]CAH0335389.1 D-alanyl-D-alanine dipeptidase [Flavobacterium sp. CECT 9288]